MTGVVASILVAAAVSVGAPGRATDEAVVQGRASTSEVTSAEAQEIRRRVKEGQKVVILADGGRELKGRIGELKADALTLFQLSPH